MEKILRFQSSVECKIGGEPHCFHSNEVLISQTEVTPQQIVERKSIPYHKKEVCRRPRSCACKNICGLLIALIMKIFQ